MAGVALLYVTSIATGDLSNGPLTLVESPHACRPLPAPLGHGAVQELPDGGPSLIVFYPRNSISAGSVPGVHVAAAASVAAIPDLSARFTANDALCYNIILFCAFVGNWHGDIPAVLARRP